MDYVRMKENCDNRASLDDLRAFARRIRLHALEMIGRSKASHLGSNFSMAELLAVLYRGGILHFDPEHPKWPGRDRFVLSKGHACAVLYASLAEMGFFPLEWLYSFYLDGGKLWGHATHKGVPGVEVSTGSLGHGLPMAVGMSLALKRDNGPQRVFCLMSDGECDEGSNWEAALFAAHHGLDNLVAIVDYNKIQALGKVSDVLGLEPFTEKWRAFGWDTREVDGHDVEALHRAFHDLPFGKGAPLCLIAHTVKGKGVGFMENQLLWHYRSPQGEEYTAARAELEGKA